ncbi:MAG: hypothetical protein H7A46_16775 [Verrucomicrobiales bacterium]|nr:hypothetical protein [Verrucomicrobiales bacterium]
MKASAYCRAMGAVTLVALFSVGCSSVPKDYHDPEHVGYREADHGIRVWLKDGFSLSSSERILVSQPDNVIVSHPNDAILEERAMQLQTCFVQALNAALHEPSAEADFNELRASVPRYRLELTIVDAWEGDRALATSLIPGTFGAGHPWILVRGKLTDTTRGEPIFRFVAKRGFQGQEAVGSWSGHEDPMEHGIRDMAMDVCQVLERARDGRPVLTEEASAR